MDHRLRITISDDDLHYAETRPITTHQPRNVYNLQTESSLTANEFYEEAIYSAASESALSRLLGIPRRLVDDTSSDLPGHVEVTTCAAKYWNGRPCIYSRTPRNVRLYYATVTGYRVPGEERTVELRYFIEPEMWPSESEMWSVLKAFKAYGRTNGKRITRWLIESWSARRVNAHVNLWPRLERAVQTGLLEEDARLRTCFHRELPEPRRVRTSQRHEDLRVRI